MLLRVFLVFAGGGVDKGREKRNTPQRPPAPPGSAVRGEMTRRLCLFALLLGAAGCLRPIRTDSRVAFTKPVDIHLQAELEPKDNRPLTEMPVEGGCGGPKVALV